MSKTAEIRSFFGSVVRAGWMAVLTFLALVCLVTIDLSAQSVTPIYSNDFSAPPGPEWKWEGGSASSLTYPGPDTTRKAMGVLGNGTAKLSLTSLPIHSQIRVEFDLYTLRSWDADEPWELKVDGVSVIRTGFSMNGAEQFFPNAWGSPTRSASRNGAAETGLIVNNQLGVSFNNNNADLTWGWARYRLSFTVPHTAVSSTVDFIGSSLQEWEDEGWALDNVVVSTLVDHEVIPMPEGEGGVLFASQKGGSQGGGAIYLRNVDGTTKVLHQFDPKTTSEPAGSMVREPGGNYFGATANGTQSVTQSTGTPPVPVYSYEPGVIFSVSQEAGSYRELRRLTMAEGQRPLGSLLVLPVVSTTGIQEASVLVGVAAGGGANNAGTVFSLKTDGSRFELLHSFPANSVPAGGLTRIGDFVYGALRGGGVNGLGSIYRFPVSNGTLGAIQTVYSFSATGLGLSSPVGQPVPDGTGGIWVSLENGGSAVGAAGNGGVVRLLPGDPFTATTVMVSDAVFGKPAGSPSATNVNGALVFTRGTTSSRGSLVRIATKATPGSPVGTLAELWRFQVSGNQLYDPVGTPVELPDGSWIGSMKSGGASGRGGVARIEGVAPGSPNSKVVSRRFTTITGNYTHPAAVVDAAINRGGHLAVIASEAERLEAAAQATFNGSAFWLGYSDRAVEGRIRPVTGENSPMTFFQSGSPNDGLTYAIIKNPLGPDFRIPSQGPTEDGIAALSFGLNAWDDLREGSTRGYILETERWGRITTLYDETQGTVGVGFVRLVDYLPTPVAIAGNPVRLTSNTAMPPNLLGFDLVENWSIEWSISGQSGAAAPAGHVLSAETQYGLGYDVSGTQVLYAGRLIANLTGQNTARMTATFLANTEAAHLQALQDLAILKYPGQNPTSITVSRTVRNSASTSVALAKTSTWAISENDSPVIGAIAPQAVKLAAGTWAPTPVAPFEIPVAVSDEEGNVAGLTVTVSSGRPSVIPDPKAVYKNNTWVIQIPSVVPDEDGTALIPLTLTVTDSGGGQVVKTLNIDVQAGPKLLSVPVGGDVRLGGPMTLTVVATGTGPLTYEWTLNGTVIAGATSPTYAVAAVTAKNAGVYSVRVVNAIGQVVSAPITIAAVTPPSFVTKPVSQWVEEGSAFAFKADAVGGGTLDYKWYRDGVEVGVGPTFSRTAATPADVGAYEVRISNTVGLIRSAPVFLTVRRPRMEPIGWGDNSSRQITFGSAWSNLVAVAAGEKFSVGLRYDGSVIMTGALSGTTNFASRVVSIAAGDQHIIALLEDGTVRAWGSTDAEVSAIPSGLSGIVKVVAGSDYTAWLDQDGKIGVAGGDTTGVINANAAPEAYLSIVGGPMALFGRTKADGTFKLVAGKGASVPAVATLLPSMTLLSAGLTHGVGQTRANANSVTILTVASQSIAVNGEVHFTVADQLPAGAVILGAELSLEYSTFWPASNPAVAGNYLRFNDFDIGELGWASSGNGGGWTALNRNYTGALGRYVQGGNNKVTLGSAWNGVSLRNVSLKLKYSSANLVAWGDNTYNQAKPPAALPSTIVDIEAGRFHSAVLGSDNSVVAWGAGSGTETAWPHFGQSKVPANLKAAQLALGGFHSVVLAHRLPEFTDSIDDVSVLVGQPAQFAAVVDGVSPITYVWRKNGAVLASQTGATLRIPSTVAADSGVYSVTVTTPYGSVSGQATLAVIIPPTVAAPAITRVVNAGTSSDFTVLPAGTGPFKYQWYLNNEPIDNATTDTFRITGAAPVNGGVYRVKVTGPGGEITTTVANITILLPPTIAAQPVATTAILNQSPSFKVTVTGGGTITYQWQRLGSASSSDWQPVAGATATTLAFPTVQTSSEGTYRLVASNPAGTAATVPVKLTVIVPAAADTPDILVENVTGTTTTPISLVAATGSNPRAMLGDVAQVIRFTAKYTGTETVKFRWFRNGTALPGSVGSYLELPPLDKYGNLDGLYQVELMNGAGPGAAVRGPGVKLTTMGLPRLTVAPPKEIKPLLGTNMRITLETFGEISSVVWYRDGTEITTGGRFANLVTNLLVSEVMMTDGGSYTAKLINKHGDVTTPVITVRPYGVPPQITSQPQPLVQVTGTSASLTVAGTGPPGIPLTYQWFLNGKAISGAIASKYDIASLGPDSVGEYTVVVSARGNGSIASVPVTVRTVVPPTIATQTVDQNVLVNTEATLKFAVNGDVSPLFPTTYEWYGLDGLIPVDAQGVTGQRTGTLKVTHTEIPRDGVAQYYCVAQNAAGKVVSKAALVLVLKSLTDIAASGDTNAVQMVDLRPGWNAVYLTVDPLDNTIEKVFEKVPWTSVWRYKNKNDKVEFIQDMSEAQWDKAQWLVRWQTLLTNGNANPHAFDNNLIKVSRNNAYLVHLSGTNSYTLPIIGGRGHLPIRWVTDNYNLTGLPIDPATVVNSTKAADNQNPAAPATAPGANGKPAPNVGDFLSIYPELWDAKSLAPRGMYRLTADGIWVAMSAQDEIRPGEAYWIYSKGKPPGTGSFHLEMDYGEALDFPDNDDRRTLKLTNLKSTPTTVRVQLKAPGSLNLDEYLAPTNDPNFGTTNYVAPSKPADQATLGVTGVTNLSPIEVVMPTVAGRVPINLALSGEITLQPGEVREVALIANRSSVGIGGWKNLLVLSDGVTTYHVPTSIRRAVTLLTGKSVTKRKGKAKSGSSIETLKYPGLWLGRVSLNGVSTVNGYETVRTVKNFVDDDGVETNAVEVSYQSKTNLTDATPVAKPLEFNVLVHVDNAGKAKILQEVYLMQAAPSTNGNPGAFVLITDRRNLTYFRGTALKGRERSGRRLSSLVLGLSGAARTNGYMAMDGSLIPGSKVSVSLGLDPQSPVNPFLHKYHPDHDNLTADFKVYKEEAYGFVREISIDVNRDQDGGGRNGAEIMKGVYSEVIRGLHRNPIRVEGPVEFVRVSDIGVLNPSTW